MPRTTPFPVPTRVTIAQGDVSPTMKTLSPAACASASRLRVAFGGWRTLPRSRSRGPTGTTREGAERARAPGTGLIVGVRPLLRAGKGNFRSARAIFGP